jgi:hypothetical protein
VPRKVLVKPTSEQRKEKDRKEREHRQEQREHRAQQRAVEVLAGRTMRPGRPFGTVGGYFKPWMKRVIGDFYTDCDLIRDLILLTPKERIQFIAELDPKAITDGSPEEMAARIKAVLEAMANTVPNPEE